MKLTPEQMHAYFEARLARSVQFGKDVLTRCPFHEDSSPSMSLDAAKGIWNCHGGCGGGGIIDFEKKFSNCDASTAMANIAQITGATNQELFQSGPEAIYSYTDERGIELFQKVRNPGKRFVQRAKDVNGNWLFRLNDIRRVLYNLPQVITANIVLIAEGEKDCDNLKHSLAELIARKWPLMRLATTTNPDGAGKWRSEFSPFLTGKDVAIFQDNDEIGRDHAQRVAASIAPLAHSVKIVDLPGLERKEDVSDFLKTHSATDLLSEIAKTPHWQPVRSEIVIPAPRFLSTGSPDIDWTVDNVIQRGANGFICSYPKVGKSWIAADLAIALALGLPWLGFAISRATKTALVTREDNPALTKWRMDRLLRGRGRQRQELDGRLFVNSKEQTADFKLDNPESFDPLVASLKQIRPEFVILDVFNVMHRAEENDNTQMAGVMERLNALQREIGCALAVVHHFTKTAEGTLTQRLRGASAIAGWAEWLIGLEVVPNETRIRKMSFEIKAADSLVPFFYEVKSEAEDTASLIERVTEPSGTQPASRFVT